MDLLLWMILLMKIKAITTAMLFCFTSNVLADENDIARLDSRVNAKIQHLHDIGFFPTSSEIEMTIGDIVNSEIIETGITIENAIDKYSLSPVLARYLEKKQADRLVDENTQNGVGTVYIPPN